MLPTHISFATIVACIVSVALDGLMEELDFLRKRNIINMNSYYVLGRKIIFPVHFLLKLFPLKLNNGAPQAG